MATCARPEMPAILIDISRLLFRRFAKRLPTGIDRVSIEYLRRYKGAARAVLSYGGLHVVLPMAASTRLFALLSDESAAPLWREVLPLLVAIGKGALAEGDLRGAILFNTGHMGLGDGRYAEGLRRRGVRPVFMVHDLIPITHPEYCRAGEMEKHGKRMRNVLSMAHGIIANSADTLFHLTAFADAQGRRLPPAVVAPLAPGATAAPAGARPMAEPYFVVLSTIEPRKNHLMLLQLWRRMAQTRGAGAPRLVIIGQRGWECENVVDMLERCAPLQGLVFEYSRCSDAELATFLHHAEALLFPSFVEGYGMPLIEALAAGVPVIASDLAVFREFAADIPEYADPLDPQRWLALVDAYSEPRSTKRQAQRERLRHFHLPTWGQHFACTDALLTALDPASEKRLGDVD